MGQVISLDEYRRQRNAPLSDDQLQQALDRLEPLVMRLGDKIAPSIVRELTAIEAEVSAGSRHAAAERIHRLADILEHPTINHGGHNS